MGDESTIVVKKAENKMEEVQDPLKTVYAPSSTVSATASASVVKKETVKNDNETFIKRTKDNDIEKLKKLKELFDLGLLTEVEYTDRKSQLVDEITGTKSNRNKNAAKYRAQQVTITNKPPPDFKDIPEETAIKHTFSTNTGRWTDTRIKVKIENEPFAKGGLRKAYHLQFCDEVDPSITYVAKIAIDPDEDRESYYQDAEMQMYAMEWAKRFNQAHPPKSVEFVKVWILELIDRPNRPLCAVERYIAGSYRKHNNNFGYVNEDERNTPQAFSHFTYEASNHTVLVCDVQGVDDLYTDPQIHTINGIGFGKGNLGPRGFEKFIETHRCNAICRFLRLPSINAKVMDVGTIPNTPFMSYQRVNVLNVSLPPSSNLHAQLSSTPLLQTEKSNNSISRRNEKDYDPTCFSCTIL